MTRSDPRASRSAVRATQRRAATRHPLQSLISRFGSDGPSARDTDRAAADLRAVRDHQSSW
ncbi:hypothetical protein [Nakamurella leprariae]|uniref:Uncharacterized protein n=1 Tax=Nakamurella leprariae TaxID=2803911 RepID=A0A938YA88_9ACTN|nr:hypothetical protein [Nakamurella leprariae]MBM9466862.1 hypothetical protein [Nakamurella leprariae]